MWTTTETKTVETTTASWCLMVVNMDTGHMRSMGPDGLPNAADYIASLKSEPPEVRSAVLRGAFNRSPTEALPYRMDLAITEREEAIARAEKAERELAKCRQDAERFSEFHAMREDRARMIEERDEAIRERDEAQSARDVATSELALAREELAAANEKNGKLAQQAHRELCRLEFSCGRLRERAEKAEAELASLGGLDLADRSVVRKLSPILGVKEGETLLMAAERVMKEREHWNKSSEDFRRQLAAMERERDAAREFHLAPGSLWDGDAVVDKWGSRTFLVPHLDDGTLLVKCRSGDIMFDPPLSDVLALAASAGLLPGASRPPVTDRSARLRKLMTELSDIAVDMQADADSREYAARRDLMALLGLPNNAPDTAVLASVKLLRGRLRREEREDAR